MAWDKALHLADDLEQHYRLRRGSQMQRAVVGVLAILASAQPCVKGAVDEKRTDRSGDLLPLGAVGRLGTLRFRHTGRGLSFSATFSADSRFIASSQELGLVRVWDVRTGKELQAMKSRNLSSFRVLGFSPHGRLLAAASHDDGSARVTFWDPSSGKLMQTFKLAPEEDVIAGHFFDEQGFVMIGSHGIARWWDLSKRERTKSWNCLAATGKVARPGKLAAVHAVFSHDGRFCALTSTRKDSKGEFVFSLCVCDLQRKAQILRLDESLGLYKGIVSLSGNGSRVAALLKRRNSGFADTVCIWSTSSGEEVFRAQRRLGSLYALSLDYTGASLVLIQAGRGAIIFDLASRTERYLLGKGETEAQYGVNEGSDGRLIIPQCLLFSPDNRLLMIELENAFLLWSLKEAKEEPSLPGHRQGVTWLRFRDDRELISGVGGWRFPAEVIRWSLDGTALAKTQTGRSFACSYDQKLWIEHEEERGDYFVRGQGVPVSGRRLDFRRRGRNWERSGFFSPDGRVFAMPVESRDDETDAFLFLDTRTGAQLAKMSVPADLAGPVAVSDDHELAAFAREANTAEVISVSSGRRLFILGTAPRMKRDQPRNDARPALGFSPDGRYLATWDSDELAVMLWDLRSGRLHRRFSYSEQASEHPPCFVLSVDSRLLAVGRPGGAVDLWEVNSSSLRRQFTGHSGLVLSVAFSPNARLLASGGSDTTVLLWNVYNRPEEGGRPFDAQRSWEDLASPDSRRAVAAIDALVYSPLDAEGLLEAKLKPAGAVTAVDIKKLLHGLASKEFLTRNRATNNLSELGRLAEPFLRNAISKTVDLEMKRRVERLLEQLKKGGAPSVQQRLRAIEVLERIGTPRCLKTLRTLSCGAAEADITQEAKQALRRLEIRSSKEKS